MPPCSSNAEADCELDNLADQLAALGADGDVAVPTSQPLEETDSEAGRGKSTDGTDAKDSMSSSADASSEDDATDSSEGVQPETLQDRVDIALGSTDRDYVAGVLEEAAASLHRHPSLNLLRSKHAALQAAAQGQSPKPGVSRRMSVAESGVKDVISLAGDAAREVGATAEEVFYVRQTHVKKAAADVQLKVGQINVQLFDGPNLIGSWLLAHLNLWEYIGESSMLRLHVKHDKSDGKGSNLIQFECSRDTGQQICEKLMQMARGILRKQKQDLADKNSRTEAIAAELDGLKGIYSVLALGLSVRANRSMSSTPMGTIAPGATVRIDAAELHEERTRVHVIAYGVAVTSRDEPQDMCGWASLKNTAGQMLIEKVDSSSLPALEEEVLARIEAALNPAMCQMGFMNTTIHAAKNIGLQHENLDKLIEKVSQARSSNLDVSQSSAAQTVSGGRSPVGGGRRMSVSQDGFKGVLDLSNKATTESGADVVVERVFEVHYNGKGGSGLKKAVYSMKVGQMAVQLFDAKHILMKSLLYTGLESWGYSVANETLTIVDHSSDKQIAYHFSISPTIGNEIADLMQSHAMKMAKAKSEEIQSMQLQKLQKLVGLHRVSNTGGLVASADIDPSSAEVGTFPNGAIVEVLCAQLFEQRTRLQVLMPDGHKGWIKWKNSYGRVLLEPTVPESNSLELKLDVTSSAAKNSFRPVPLSALSLSDAMNESGSSTMSLSNGDGGSPSANDGPLSLLDRIEDALDQTCTNLVQIQSVIRDADQQRYAHPALTALRGKYDSLTQQTGGNASPMTPGGARRLSVSQGGVADVVDLANQVAQNAGVAGEEIFDVTQHHMKDVPKNIKLKVGQMGVQLFDGPHPLESYTYSKISLWEYFATDSALRIHLVGPTARSSERKGGKLNSANSTIAYGCPKVVGERICEMMMKHAQKMAVVAKNHKQNAVEDHLRSLSGRYRVRSAHGVIVRSQAMLDSEQIGVILPAQIIEVDNAVVINKRMRVHIVGQQIMLAQSTSLQDATNTNVEGWVSLQGPSGAPLIAKDDTSGEESPQSPRSPRTLNATAKKSVLKPRRRASIASGVIDKM
eukprot:SAG31_NODE_3161_length_4607_cov_3.352484_1_plen_1082_part_10